MNSIDKIIRIISMMLPYGIYVETMILDKPEIARVTGIDEDGHITLDLPCDCVFHARFCKPCLRNINNMTPEEKAQVGIYTGRSAQYQQKVCLDSDSVSSSGTYGGYPVVYQTLVMKYVEWMLKNHFNIWSLQPDEYIEVSDNNNPYKEI